MKPIPLFLRCALLVPLMQLASPALAAPAQPSAGAKATAKALSPAEVKRIRNENYAKGNRVLGDLRKACFAQRKEGSAKLQPLIDEYLSILRFTEETGRPVTFTPSTMHRRVAETLSNPISLRLRPLVEKHLAEAAKLAANPAEKAEAAYAKARFELQWHISDSPEKNRELLMETFRNKEIPSTRRLDLMRFAIEEGPLADLDFESVAWEAIKDDPKAHYLYYRTMLRIITVRGRRNDLKLKAGNLPVDVVRLCDRALADPAVGPKSDFLQAKADALVTLRKLPEAEKFLAPYVASTNPSIRYDGAMALGDFYVKTAERYYGEPNEGRMRKAIEAYQLASAANKRTSRPLYRIGTAALRLHDDDLAIRTYESIIPLEGGRTNATVAIGLGDAYFAREDWKQAASWYGLYAGRLSAVPCLNLCRSLFVLGRYEETAENLEHYAKVARGRYAKQEARYFQQEVAKHLPPSKD